MPKTAKQRREQRRENARHLRLLYLRRMTNNDAELYWLDKVFHFSVETVVRYWERSETPYNLITKIAPQENPND